MPTPRHRLPRSDAQIDADRQTAGLIGVAVVLLLLIVGLFLVHTLHDTGHLEDCLLAGRLDCDRLLTKGY